MTDFSIRADSVDVEQIMKQIRMRIREKRGVDYTEADVRALASVKLEKFLDPSKVRSDLVEHYRRQHPKTRWPELPPLPSVSLPAPVVQPEKLENYVFEHETIYASSRGAAGRLLRFVRKLLNPILKLFFNPNPLIYAMHQQGVINQRFEDLLADERHQFDRVSDAFARLAPVHEAIYRTIGDLNELLGHKFAGRDDLDALHYEVLNNLVVEMSRLGIETKNLKMRVESLSTRLDFNERRSRALESVVEYRPETAPAGGIQRDLFQAVEAGPGGEAPAPAGGESPRSRQRRRRRGGRGRSPRSEGASAVTAPPGATGVQAGPDEPTAPRDPERVEGDPPARPPAAPGSEPSRLDADAGSRPDTPAAGSPGPGETDQ
jgi:hypothetical protein